MALNLVTNAVKFTASGEVRLQVEVGDGAVTVLVSDTGLGVPLAEQEAIFDEFRQSERTAAAGYGGLGMGLAICRQLVEMHGGQIGVRSSGEEESGSTFYFTLPMTEWRAARNRRSARVCPDGGAADRARPSGHTPARAPRSSRVSKSSRSASTRRQDWFPRRCMPSPPGSRCWIVPASERRLAVDRRRSRMTRSPRTFPCSSIVLQDARLRVGAGLSDQADGHGGAGAGACSDMGWTRPTMRTRNASSSWMTTR